MIGVEQKSNTNSNYSQKIEENLNSLEEKWSVNGHEHWTDRHNDQDVVVETKFGLCWNKSK